mgnify:CR=1 FL=1
MSIESLYNQIAVIPFLYLVKFNQTVRSLKADVFPAKREIYIPSAAR